MLKAKLLQLISILFVSTSNVHNLSLLTFRSVIRDGCKSTISVAYVVPGDVILLKPRLMCSDVVLIKASPIIVDESALTGESNPIAKIEIDVAMNKSLYDSNHHKTHTIFAGTEIIECGGNKENLGLVLATGSFTSKGRLLSDVLSYQRHKFLFDDEVKFVLLILFFQCVLYMGIVLARLSEQFVYAWFYCGDSPSSSPSNCFRCFSRSIRKSSTQAQNNVYKFRGDTCRWQGECMLF
jgi:magnesium-transporting ATPase (P-type)